MENIPEQLKPYFRKVMAYPEGAVVHYGDCMSFNSGICDCGLLRTLSSMEDPDKWYPNFSNEIGFHLRKIEQAGKGG